MTHEHMKLLLADMITDKEYHPILIIDNENNDGAVEFYKQFNFKTDRTVPGYYENGDGAIVMYLPLEGGKISCQ